MVDITDQFARECLDVFYRMPADSIKSMRAALEHAFTQQEPVPVAEATDAAVEVLAKDFWRIYHSLNPNSSRWEEETGAERTRWRKVARHVLASRQPNAVDVPESQLAALDALVTFYVTQGWPSYTIAERAARPAFTQALSDIQTAALKRHRDRQMATALRASATPKAEAVDWVEIAQRSLRAVVGYDKEAIINGLCEQVAALRAKVV